MPTCVPVWMPLTLIFKAKNKNDSRCRQVSSMMAPIVKGWKDRVPGNLVEMKLEPKIQVHMQFYGMVQYLGDVFCRVNLPSNSHSVYRMNKNQQALLQGGFPRNITYIFGS